MRTFALALACGLLVLLGTAGAQEHEIRPAQPAAPAEPVAQFDVHKLPLNMARVQRRVREAVEREEMIGSTLRYSIDIFAETPPLVIFGPQTDFRFAPVPFSAPTHQDMLNIVTPKEFRSPVMNFGNLLDLFGRRSKTQKK